MVQLRLGMPITFYKPSPMLLFGTMLINNEEKSCELTNAMK